MAAELAEGAGVQIPPLRNIENCNFRGKADLGFF